MYAVYVKFLLFLISLKAQVVSGFQSPRLSSPAPHRAGGECLICNLHVQIQVQVHVYDY